ncbi:MAG TPA: sugar phosphate isomerase/epimerase [Chitinophagaceae bacterium]|jgi:sugar phosphate isomerase/epimerase
MERRHFLKTSGTIALSSFLAPQLFNKSPFFNSTDWPAFGIQLYTLSDLMTKDPKDTLQKVAAIGYKELEGAASEKGYYYGFKPKELAAMVKDMDMHWRSQHVLGAPFDIAQIQKMAKPKTAEDSARLQRIMDRMKNMAPMPTLKNDSERLANEAAEGGLSYLVCASIPVGTFDEIKTAVDVFSKAGEACKNVGVQFAYHNHTTEFDEVEGHRPFDYILSNTDKGLVKMELDLAWATKANQDPVGLFKLHPGRFPLWHVKDLDKNTKNPAEVGSGIIDFKRIFDNASESGMKYFFVEQDQAPQPLENVTHSYNNLKKILA